MTLTRAGEVVPVEPQVFDLLHLLLRHPDRVVTKDEIIDTVWQGRIVSESAISARIAAVRKAVGDDGKRQELIRTIARRGLQVVAPVDTSVSAHNTDSAQSPRIRYATADDGHSLGYAVGGSGNKVLRCGVTTIDIQAEWNVEVIRRELERLHSRTQLLRYDVRGYGQSAGSETMALSADTITEDMRAVADAAGYDRFAVYTKSSGAQTGMRFAARYPDRVSKLVINGGYVHGRMRRKTEPDPDPIRGLIAEGWRKPEMALSNAYLMSYFPEVSVDVITEISRMVQESCTPEQVLVHRDMINRADSSDLLAQIRCPTLVIHARHDAIHPLPEARKLAAGIEDAELVVLDSANHMPIYGDSCWEAFMDTVLGFLAEPDAG